MSGVSQAVFMNQRSFAAPPGQQAYTSAGSYTWVAPSGVTSVSVVAVGGGGSRSGGGLGYKNNISVTPGNSYSVVVGAGGTGDISPGLGGNSYFLDVCTVKGGAGGGGTTAGSYTGDGGGNGGLGSFAGGGAGGYSGNGGAQGSGAAANSGGGGGGGFACCCDGYGGGGVGIFGKGATGGVNQGGSGGANPTVNTATTGGAYGGGGSYSFSSNLNRYGASGAVRIIWPGNTRSFPSTCTGDL